MDINKIECPYCKAPMNSRMRYTGVATQEYPLGIYQVYWWECPICETCSPDVDTRTNKGKDVAFLIAETWANKIKGYMGND